MHLADSNSTGVQTETVSVRLGGEAVSKNAGQVLRGDSDSAVVDLEADLSLRVAADANAYLAKRAITFNNSLLGVPKQVH